MDIDLESDWSLFRAKVQRRVISAPVSLDDDLEASWRALRNLPDSLYRVLPSYHLHGMSLHVMNCHGETSRPSVSGDDFWIVSFRQVLWQGKYATLPARSRNGSQERVPKSQIDTTLEAALERLKVQRDRHVDTLRARRTSMFMDIEALYREIDTLDEQIAYGYETDHVQEVTQAVRSQLLGVLQGRVMQGQYDQSRLLGLLQRRSEQLGER